jgi:hypothetical protein
MYIHKFHKNMEHKQQGTSPHNYVYTSPEKHQPPIQ